VNDSQNARVLKVLRDMKPHTLTEIHERAGFMRLNSRVSELRSRGYLIDCWRDGQTYLYQMTGHTLTATLEEARAAKTDGESVSPASHPRPGLGRASSSVSETPNPAAKTDAASDPHRDTASRDGAGTLELFTLCEIDESAGQRGAYGDAA